MDGEQLQVIVATCKNKSRNGPKEGFFLARQKCLLEYVGKNCSRHRTGGTDCWKMRGSDFIRSESSDSSNHNHPFIIA